MTGQGSQGSTVESPFDATVLMRAPHKPMEQFNLFSVSQNCFPLVYRFYQESTVYDMLCMYSKWGSLKMEGWWLRCMATLLFLPKVVKPQMVNQVVVISACQPNLAVPQEGAGLLTLCSVRALRPYVARAQSLRCSHSQLFVCFGGKKDALPLSKQCLSHWIVNTIAEAYSGQILSVPSNVVPHSTRSVGSFWAALKGVPISEISCNMAWSLYVFQVLKCRHGFPCTTGFCCVALSYLTRMWGSGFLCSSEHWCTAHPSSSEWGQNR